MAYATCGDSDYLDTTDDAGSETDDYFTDDVGSDWGQLELIRDEDNLITMESTHHANTITKSNFEECWQCTQCHTINNIKICIKKHGSKCLGCQRECYIKFQTETIMRSKWDSTDAKYLLQIGKLWSCQSCQNINQKSNKHCTICKQPSHQTMIREKIAKFTDDERMDHLIHGFVRVHEYYLKISVVRDLFILIQNFYVIDYVKAGWIIGNVKAMSLLAASKLKVGDKLDHKHKVSGKFEAAEVRSISSILGVELKYEGRIKTARIDYNLQLERIAEAGAVSSRPAHRLKDVQIGDEVDVNPIYFVSNSKHSGWKRGVIKKLDETSGQVQVEYKYNGTGYKYWTHLDNEDEIAEYESMTSKIGMTISDLLQDDIEDDLEETEQRYIDMGDEWCD